MIPGRGPDFAGESPRDVTFTVGTPAGEGGLHVDTDGRETPARVPLAAGPAVLSLELEGAKDAAETAGALTIVFHRR